MCAGGDTKSTWGAARYGRAAGGACKTHRLGWQLGRQKTERLLAFKQDRTPAAAAGRGGAGGAAGVQASAAVKKRSSYGGVAAEELVLGGGFELKPEVRARGLEGSGAAKAASAARAEALTGWRCTW